MRPFGLRDIPVSDADGETISSKRPGMNAQHERETDGDQRHKSRSKNRKHNRRNRRPKSEKRIQAENQQSLPGPGGEERSSAPSAQGAKEQKRKNRRRNRRPGSTGGHSGDEQNQPSSQTIADAPFQPVTKGRKAGRKNGQRNRDLKGGKDHQSAPPNRRGGASQDQAASEKQRFKQGRPERRGKHQGGAQQANGQKGSDGKPHRPRHQRGRDWQGRKQNNAYAALDLGTNNCRLLVAVPQQTGRFKVIDAFSRIVRLGEGLGSSGRLSEPAMDRAIGALKACATKLSSRNMKGVRLIATEACRQADNGAQFLQRVKDEAGLKLEIIDRETEARLAVAGCASLVDRSAKGVVLFDIGGGSSELALLDLTRRKKHDLGSAMVSWTSLPLGVVTLSEKHGGGRNVTREVFAGMVEEVRGILENFEGRKALENIAGPEEVHLLGTSGTVTTLAGIHLKLPRYDRRKVDGIWMQSADLDAMIDDLLDMTYEQRQQNPCIGQERADLVLAGCAILVAIRSLWPCPRLRVADRGLREGLLTEMMQADNAWTKRPKPYRDRRSSQPKSSHQKPGQQAHPDR